jgi:starch synthase
MKVDDQKAVKKSDVAGLSRFALKDEHLVQGEYVKEAISQSFEDGRAFAFFASADLIEDMRHNRYTESYTDRVISIKNEMLDAVAEQDQFIRSRLDKDTRLSDRLFNAVYFLHLALTDHEFSSLATRRFVIIKELAGKPTLYHVSNETTVISHIGQGPYWEEISSLYLGLKIFDVLDAENRRGEHELYNAFIKLLKVEERAIETGFTHGDFFGPDFSIALNNLVDAVIDYTGQVELRAVEPVTVKDVKPFTDKMRERFLKMLDARYYHEPMHFNYEENLKAIDSIARLARRYKTSGDRDSLKEVIRLLVSASGHDIHEIRNRANIILERLFAPKPYDLPLATTFYNIQYGEELNLSFDLPENKNGYFIRLYRYAAENEIFVDGDIEFAEYDLTKSEKNNNYELNTKLNSIGHYDFVVYKKKQKNHEWVEQYGTSGRINVVPDVRGEIILQIFTDIHGHTKVYWMDEGGHPGLVYNENGQVIRTGRFSDIAYHLEDLKERLSISSIYILGAQKRGSNSEDWAEGATSPSPFSPISLVDIEDNLGGEEEFKELVKKAHTLDIKIIVDIIPHINRHSDHLDDKHVVYCYGHDGNLYPRSATDGRYGSWDDGKLLNYRQYEIWQWVANSVRTLVEKYDVDGIRFDSAHAVPIMMKKNNYQYVYNRSRTHEEMVEGRIIVNDEWDHHFITTGYYDCQCRDSIAVPFHQYLMFSIQRMIKEFKKSYFIYIAECFWGHERFLARSGIIPYNASFFKVCENISHGKSDVREIYHLYDGYYPFVLPKGTELLGIFGNHDERRALNTFGQHGLKAVIALTSFMSNIIMDYEGNAEGEGWKVFLDNIYVNWNLFEYASHRSVEKFYREIYRFHKENKGKGYLIWANNHMVAAAIKPSKSGFWIGAFNFADSSQTAAMQFDNPGLPLHDDEFFKVVDPIYSKITDTYSYFTGKELKVSHVNTIVSFVDRMKLIKLERIAKEDLDYNSFFKDSYYRLCSISDASKFLSNFSFLEAVEKSNTADEFLTFIKETVIPLLWDESKSITKLGIKRILYFLYQHGYKSGKEIIGYIQHLSKDKDETIKQIAQSLEKQHSTGPIVFMSSEADPFTKSGGLANVVFELPRELVKHGEEVYVITGYYRHGSPKAVEKMQKAIKKFKVSYTGKNVRFKIMHMDFEVGIHTAQVHGVTYYLLDHHELFDGLYWGVTSEEKLRRRIGFARACAEVICTFGLKPYFTFTNDAFAGLFNGIVRSDPFYSSNENFRDTTFLHIIHNGGWQYFDAYSRWERGFDLFNLFNLPMWKADNFMDPVFHDRINCMASGIRFADRTITVSPTYARQIEYQSDGLEHILFNVLGISNGVGHDLYERMKAKFDESKFIERNYKPTVEHIKANPVLLKTIKDRYPEILDSVKKVESISDPMRRDIVTRKMYKLMLQFERGLEVNPDRVLFTMIHRITEQKGYQLLLDASEGLFNSLKLQGVMGGSVSSGDNAGESIAHGLWLLSQFYPQSANVGIGFQDVSVPLFASDLFLMPSMNEPGGISQIEAFLCGCLLVARATGGLRDTVFPVRLNGDQVEGNGFLFSDFTPWAFYDAMERAVNFFQENDDETIYKARQNAKETVFYWDIAARQYIENIYKMKEIVRLID